MAESSGLADGAFFVSKNEIITWINNILNVNLTKIEQLGTGAVLSQLFDAYYPGSVPLGKIFWKARLETDFITNFKILQQTFLKLDIKKDIEVSFSFFLIF